jgi:nucleotide-binding universal stress UspA family protein
MNDPFEFNTLLVPIDFSPASEAAFGRTMSLATGEKPVLILLHVIDPTLVDFAVEHGWGSEAEITAQMRRLAEQEMEGYRERATKSTEIDTVVSEGVPFLEILRKSEDFAVDAIVLGKVGTRGAIEKLLFGSTAEKVLRGSRRPVIVLPFEE